LTSTLRILAAKNVSGWLVTRLVGWLDGITHNTNKEYNAKCLFWKFALPGGYKFTIYIGIRGGLR
jgi:hypothetical protein